MYSFFNLFLYLILATIFGPGAAIWQNYYGDFYSLSKTYPIFDKTPDNYAITPEWMLLLEFFIFWLGFYFMQSFYYELKKYLNRPPNLDWWQRDSIYQIYIKSFYDSNNDGYGDLQGVTKKLDYLNHIGFKSICLTPFYPSGGKDGGYDVTSLKHIDPIYGNMTDFDELITKAHEKGMHVIMDFVPNHTSDQHDWFKKSCESGLSSNPYRDYYVWYASEDRLNPPNNWRSVFGQSAWTYNESRKAWYLHQFLKEQPDLNFRCPAVHKEMRDALTFWLETKKVDGFRIDAFKHLYESAGFEDEPSLLSSSDSGDQDFTYDGLEHTRTSGQTETLELLREWRQMFDEISERTNSSKALIVECSYTKTKELAPYYKNNGLKTAHFPFNFQLNAFNKNSGRDLTPPELKRSIEDYLKVVPSDCWANWQLGNHDVSRAASRLGSENVNIANVLNLLLGGTSLVYYGEEIGMQDLPVDQLSFEKSKDEFGKKYGPNDYAKYSRDFSRTPMQWTSATGNSGFSQHTEPWLPVNKDSSSRNVQTQLSDSDSHLNRIISILKLREKPSFQWGKLKIHVVNENIFSFTRCAYDFPSYLVVMNISDRSSWVCLDTGSDIAPRAYVSCYIPGSKYSDLTKTYAPNAPVLTKNVMLDARDCLILTWSG